MAKWADYCIHEVRYDTDHKRIVKVKAKEDKGEELGSSEILTRQKVISNIKDGIEYITVFKKDGENSWSKGKKVIIVTVDNVEYIKTESNEKKVDNLENLPEF